MFVFLLPQCCSHRAVILITKLLRSCCLEFIKATGVNRWIRRIHEEKVILDIFPLLSRVKVNWQLYDITFPHNAASANSASVFDLRCACLSRTRPIFSEFNNENFTSPLETNFFSHFLVHPLSTVITYKPSVSLRPCNHGGNADTVCPPWLMWDSTDF